MFAICPNVNVLSVPIVTLNAEVSLLGSVLEVAAMVIE